MFWRKYACPDAQGFIGSAGEQPASGIGSAKGVGAGEGKPLAAARALIVLLLRSLSGLARGEPPPPPPPGKSAVFAVL